MTSFVVYGFAGSTFTRIVRMAFAEKAVPYEHVAVGIHDGANRSAEHLARHPFGKVPALGVDGTYVYETDAILELLEGLHPEPPLFPDDVFARARMRQWMSVIHTYAYPAMVSVLMWERLLKPMMGREPDMDAVADVLPEVRRQLGLFDEQLAGTACLAGDAFSAADLYLAAVVAFVARTPEGPDLLAAAPHVARWWENMQKRQSVRDTALEI
jgi:glutathione S-transferase